MSKNETPQTRNQTGVAGAVAKTLNVLDAWEQRELYKAQQRRKRKHGDLKAHTEQKEIKKRGANTDSGSTHLDHSREDVT